MTYRRLIGVWALVALLAGQMALAQHSAVHADHGLVSYDIQSQNDLPDQKNHKDCPEYLLGKSLQAGDLPDASLVLTALPQERAAFISPQVISLTVIRTAHHPRAPPHFLI